MNFKKNRQEKREHESAVYYFLRGNTINRLEPIKLPKETTIPIFLKGKHIHGQPSGCFKVPSYYAG
ncbi:MAG: hypothetical protein HN597_14715 [Desulfobacula sp.]|uniref:hypothetical protein n=1 Tax=Desulfobacula sp. TaxID=2593537 RepID=UPI0039B85498|nr:hypothetical protein [Desulfobacula sp.]